MLEPNFRFYNHFNINYGYNITVMDALVKLHPPKTAITSLIDEITEVHLDYIETFRKVIDDGGEEG